MVSSATMRCGHTSADGPQIRTTRRHRFQIADRVKLTATTARDPSRCHVLRDGSRMPLAAFLADYDIVVNCVLQDTDAPLMLVTAGDLGSFAPGTLIVEVSCDEGMGFSWAGWWTAKTRAP